MNNFIKPVGRYAKLCLCLLFILLPLLNLERHKPVRYPSADLHKHDTYIYNPHDEINLNYNPANLVQY